MADKKQPQQLQLPTGIKIDYLEGAQLAQVKEKHSKLTPVSDTAVAMSKRMLANDLQAGAHIQLNSAVLQQHKESIRKLLKRDLDRIANRQKLRLSTRVVEDNNSLIFYYEQRRTVTKKEKAAAAA
jgi:hypothetical protein